MIRTAIILTLALAWLTSPRPARPVLHRRMKPGKKYSAPADWEGTPVDKKGRFVNAEFPFYQNYLEILVWLPGHIVNLIRNRRRIFPVTRLKSANPLDENNVLIWLGHASFFLRVNNTSILIDPHFYNAAIYKRHTGNPVDPALFRNINYILISHDHADHCDKKSIQLLSRNNPGATFLSGLNMEKLIRPFTKGPIKILTADWYQAFDLKGSVEIYFVPCRHYSKRIFNAFNCRLWGGFVIRYRQASGNYQTIYYGGDSGYGRHFKDIGKMFKPGIAILPIGSYMPRWFMKPNHMSPKEALQAFEDCGAGRMIPMHYGTFNLSSEDMGTPRKVLLQFKEGKNIADTNPGDIIRI